MQSKYDTYAEGGQGSSFDDTELIVSSHSMLQATLTRFFGTDNSWGQSVGLGMEDVALEDGLLYLDPEKGKLKIFSWTNVLGLSPIELLEEDGDVVDVTDAEPYDRLSRGYATTDKTYRLVAARVPETVDEDGEVIIPASSMERAVEQTDDGWEYGEFEDLEGELPAVADATITWYGGSPDSGASPAALRLTSLLAGPEYVNDGDDVFNFISNTDADNILRDDLDGRRVRFFITTRTSEESGRDYNYVVVEDLKTDEPVTYDNSGEGDSGN